jgi:conjugal transfer pilus assembly protein TraK
MSTNYSIPMPMPLNNRLRPVLAALFVLGASGAAHAITTLEMRDGASATAKLSIKDPTRIRVEGARITDVRGSVIRTKDNTAGLLSVSLDEDKGELYLQPVGARGLPPATSIFVSTATTTYTLVLVPMDIPADTIAIQDRGLAFAAPNKRLPGHERELITLLKTVATQASPPALHVVTVNRPVRLWDEARFVLEQRYEGHPRWTVEVFELTNLTASPMVLDEREFLTEGVAAVALEQTILAPGEAVPVRVVREMQR